jgi:hypothetical protein
MIVNRCESHLRLFSPAWSNSQTPLKEIQTNRSCLAAGPGHGEKLYGGTTVYDKKRVFHRNSAAEQRASRVTA